MEDRRDTRKFDYRLFLTDVLSMCSILGMARLKDIVAGLAKQSGQVHEELIRASNERAELQDAARRFRELDELIRAKEESYKIGFALLLAAPQKTNDVADAFVSSVDVFKLEDGDIRVSESDIDPTNFALWKVIREILKQVSEVRVYELEEHLAWFKVPASRSAIESALATHKKEFKVTKRGREKYVSLK